MKTAFVFSGGASLGSVEVGMLKAIVEHGITPDLVLGTSVGSLNGAFYAHNPTMEGVEILESIWKQLRARDVFTPSPLTPVKNIATFGQYLISPKNLRTLITENLPYEKIEEAQIPLYIVSADIKTGDEIVFDKGLLKEAIMASAGIPGVFPPQHMGSNVLVDGGMVNNAPISTAVKLGAERVVVFPIGFPYTPDQDPKNLGEILIPAFLYLLNRQLSADYHIYKDKVELIIIPPPENIEVGPHDFSKSEQLISRAYNRTKLWLSKGGFEDNIDEFIRPCDVHSSQLNLRESIEPDKEKSAMDRIRENVPQIAHLHENIENRKKIISENLENKKNALKKHIKKEKHD
ncbi:hypothetical protein NEF87_000513 [Candidatus Lokiarchaeum ossiferum]|uniref:PNPLA domain-containing protein n=1 Tax=Candidatus Lokiarchaeum ossiferum TaxID=2951803 RepID=A0ABY6HL41_9ARCH|nr:hypothetical protein NEF87_000513 [Candidatus Lokiarchaeum sp. B-35]